MNRLEHLTQFELDDALICGVDELSAEARGHLAACELCQTALAAVSAPIATFNEVSLAWSERQAATMESPLPAEAPEAAGSRAWKRLLSAPGVAATGAVVAVTALGFATAHRPPTESHRQAAVRALPPATDFSPGRAARIARDNQMLAEIERALQSEDETADAVETNAPQSRPTIRTAGAHLED